MDASTLPILQLRNLRIILYQITRLKLELELRQAPQFMLLTIVVIEKLGNEKVREKEYKK